MAESVQRFYILLALHLEFLLNRSTVTVPTTVAEKFGHNVTGEMNIHGVFKSSQLGAKHFEWKPDPFRPSNLYGLGS
ncbi:hypothetical protein AVEN_265391-1 [Araneus ventricosus]|uniref:Uncharacterized protein n=1 Tax=Araneus ventricosus TaxID=182803 RepID=A0A4Y2HQK3_ARAVE|nr:hypothetical protein AVEN_265391-1 [Araneus ventricosus]